MAQTIKIPRVVWALGDREGAITEVRPLYYSPKDGPRVRVGEINPDYAEPLMKALSKVKS